MPILSHAHTLHLLPLPQAFVQFASLEAANEARQQLSSGAVTLPSPDSSTAKPSTAPLRANAHFSKMKELVHKGHALYWDHNGATGGERKVGTIDFNMMSGDSQTLHTRLACWPASRLQSDISAQPPACPMLDPLLSSLPLPPLSPHFLQPRAPPSQDAAQQSSPTKRPLPDSHPTTAAGAPLHLSSLPPTLSTLPSPLPSPFPSPLTAFPLSAPAPFPSPLPPSSGTSTPTFSRAVGAPRHAPSLPPHPSSPHTSAGAVGHLGSFLESQGSPHWSGLRGLHPPSTYLPTTGTWKDGDPPHAKSAHLPSPLIPPNGHFTGAPTPTGHVTSPYHDATPPPLLAYPSSLPLGSNPASPYPPGSALSPYPSPYLVHPSPFSSTSDNPRWALPSDAPLPSPPAAAAPESHELAHLEGFPLDDPDDTPTSSHEQQRQPRQSRARRGDAASIDAAAVPPPSHPSEPAQRKPSARAPAVAPVEPKGVVLLVTGLDPSLTTCDGLYALFSNYGEVVRCRRLLHKPDHALVEMHDAFAAANAVNLLRGCTLFNKPIKVGQHAHAPTTVSTSPCGLHPAWE